jgi:hypothetical protein
LKYHSTAQSSVEYAMSVFPPATSTSPAGPSAGDVYEVHSLRIHLKRLLAHTMSPDALMTANPSELS